jgi:hypothetical protein
MYLYSAGYRSFLLVFLVARSPIAMYGSRDCIARLRLLASVIVIAIVGNKTLLDQCPKCSAAEVDQIAWLTYANFGIGKRARDADACDVM